MTTLNLAAIMDAIAARVVAGGVTTTANTFAWPVPSWTPPCTVVGYPRPGMINLDSTFKRGGVEATFPVWVVVGKTIDRSTRDTLSALLDGGAATLKTAIEADGSLGGVVASTLVKGPEIQTLTQPGTNIEYLAAMFEVETIS